MSYNSGETSCHKYKIQRWNSFFINGFSNIYNCKENRYENENAEYNVSNHIYLLSKINS